MVQTMAHTCYRVADLKESVKFYTEAFDFVVSRERDFPEYKFTLVYLTLPGSNYGTYLLPCSRFKRIS